MRTSILSSCGFISGEQNRCVPKVKTQTPKGSGSTLSSKKKRIIGLGSILIGRPAPLLDELPPAAALDEPPPAAALDGLPPAAALDGLPPAAALDGLPPIEDLAATATPTPTELVGSGRKRKSFTDCKRGLFNAVLEVLLYGRVPAGLLKGP